MRQLALSREVDELKKENENLRKLLLYAYDNLYYVDRDISGMLAAEMEDIDWYAEVSEIL